MMEKVNTVSNSSYKWSCFK